ncbi:MAG TPA: carboxypeptidase-like regulatory domain-containing protein [Actinomycetota bacterium]|nr:carboxypeptidase-like regulatory domain-containing protein [Actinomycetota bacterium]
MVFAVAYVLAPAGYAMTLSSRARNSPDSGAVVYGTVVVANGGPLAGARVTVTCTRHGGGGFFLFHLFGDQGDHDHEFFGSATTGPTGTYQISGVPSDDQCTVRVSTTVHHREVSGSIRLHTRDHQAYEVDATLGRRDFFFFGPISSY